MRRRYMFELSCCVHEKGVPEAVRPDEKDSRDRGRSVRSRIPRLSIMVALRFLPSNRINCILVHLPLKFVLLPSKFVLLPCKLQAFFLLRCHCLLSKRSTT